MNNHANYTKRHINKKKKNGYKSQTHSNVYNNIDGVIDMIFLLNV